MRTKTLMAIMILAGALFLLFNPVSSIADQVYTIGIGNTGATGISGYPAPYGTVDVALNVTGKIATFTFTPDTTSGFTYLLVDSSAADVNLNKAGGGTFTAAFVSATAVTTDSFSAPTPVGPPPPSATPFGSGTVDGFGSFNLTFDLAGSVEAPASQIIYTVTRSTGTWANASDVLALNNKDYVAAMHVAVFNSNDVNNGNQLRTGFAGNGVRVPEPGILILLGIAMSAVGVASRYVRKI